MKLKKTKTFFYAIFGLFYIVIMIFIGTRKKPTHRVSISYDDKTYDDKDIKKENPMLPYSS